MSIVRALRQAADHAIEMAAGLAAAEKVAQRLERARPLPAPGDPDLPAVGGGSIGGGPGAVSSAAPAKVGSGTGSAGGQGGGVKQVATNADKLRAIIESSGVAAPPRKEWSPSGLPEAGPGTIVSTVISLGVQAPVQYLRWVAGLLAYSGSNRVSSGAGGGTAGGGVGQGARVPIGLLRGEQTAGASTTPPGSAPTGNAELQAVAKASSATADGVAQMVAEIRALRADLRRPDVYARAGRS